MKAEQKHDEVTRLIWLKPEIIGLDNIVMSAREVNLLQPNGSLYHQPDNLCFDPTSKILYNIEYKTNNNPRKAKFQLQRQEAWLHNLFPNYRVRNLYVHQDFSVDRV